MADIVAADPAVAGVVSFIGAGTINATSNAGRLTIALKPIHDRDPAAIVTARLSRAVAGIAGITAFFQPVQDIQIGTRVSRTQFQYTLMDTDPAELSEWAPKLLSKLQTMPELANVASDQQNDGFRTYIRVDRDAAMRLGVSMQNVQDILYDSFGQRQISTIFGQANQYRVVLEADPAWQADPSKLLLLRVPGTGDSQVPLSAIARLAIYARNRAAGGHPSGAVPLGRPSASTWRRGVVARRGGCGGRRGGTPDRNTRYDFGQLFRRRRRVPEIARRRAVADPGGGGGDLHRARRALRKLDPPDHHPVHPAVGRHRRAAGADAVRHRPVAGGAGRHRAADGHREKERDHDDRLRHRCRARARPDRRRRRSRRPAGCASAPS